VIPAAFMAALKIGEPAGDSDLARDAGINDIGSSGNSPHTGSRIRRCAMRTMIMISLTATAITE